MSRIAVSFPPRPGPLAAGGGAFVQMTAVDGLEHEIGPDDHSSGLGRGCYRAMCGAVIAPASLTASPGAVCRVCAVEAVPHPETVETDSRRARRSTAIWLRGLRARAARLTSTVWAGGVDVAA
ncbi:hypothetical protein DMP15_28125 [Pseudonocardia sp. UM4_GMWB1]|jgi:hypothetical protein|nr:hypothetical protein [Pseudonocardia alni]